MLHHNNHCNQARNPQINKKLICHLSFDEHLLCKHLFIYHSSPNNLTCNSHLPEQASRHRCQALGHSHPFFALAGSAQSQILYSEGFTSVTPPPAGWASNNSLRLEPPVGSRVSQQPLTHSAARLPLFILVPISTMLPAPTSSATGCSCPMTLTNGDVFTFYTRVPTGGGQFPTGCRF